MHLHSGNAHRFQRIQNGDGSMGVGGRVDDNAVINAQGLLNFIHQAALVVGLVLVDCDMFCFGGFIQQRQQIGEGIAAVNARFPDAQHIDIGSIDD